MVHPTNKMFANYPIIVMFAIAFKVDVCQPKFGNSPRCSIQALTDMFLPGLLLHNPHDAARYESLTAGSRKAKKEAMDHLPVLQAFPRSPRLPVAQVPLTEDAAPSGCSSPKSSVPFEDVVDPVMSLAETWPEYKIHWMQHQILSRKAKV